ncbi:MAG: hypothetical protein ABIJ09_15655 [Pseudomonadota bacterium]
MNKLFKILTWIGTVLLILFFIGLGLRVAKLFLGLAVVVGIAVVLYVLFGPARKTGAKGSG